jgi:FAD-linked oxidoreductase
MQHAYPSLRWAPRTVDELVNKIASQPGPVRPVGAGHSFMPLVPTSGTLLTLDAITGIERHDPSKHTAVVRAGTRLGELGPALAAIGQEMPNLPDINKQSLAGALSTATHGTGRALQAMHGGVTAFDLVTAEGELLLCSASDNRDVFRAARVGLGMFGILTRVELQNRPLQRVRKRTWVTSTEEALAEWPSLMARHRNVEFYVVPFTGLSAIIALDETDQPAKPRGPDRDAETLMDLKLLRDLFGFSSGLRRRVAHAAMKDMPPEEAVDEGWKLLSNERPVRFHEMEWHFPLERQLAALEQALAVIERHRPDVFFPIEVRVIAQDDAWLSPFQDGPTGSVAVHAYYQDDFRFLFEMVEPVFRKHGGRPHWGKLNSLKAADFAALYPRWRDAMQVRAQLDPRGRLLNDYLRSLVS